MTPNTALQLCPVASSTHPDSGTAIIPAIVAHVFPVANTKPACRGATSRCDTLTPASVNALNARPTSTSTAAANTLASVAPAPPKTAAPARQTAGPTMPTV